MSSHDDAFGSLAALFTTGGAGDGSGGASGGARTGASTVVGAGAELPFDAVVTVLVGNLPVMAGLWTTQFADAVGRLSGPTCLVRFERGDVTVELLHSDGRQLPAPAPSALSRWLPRGASSARRWIVCLPAETPAAEVLSGGTEVLIMTGADEAAVTGAYLRIKHLVDEAVHRGTPLERIGVVLVGASPEQSELAAARLSDAARQFLGIEIDVIARIPRLERVDSSARATYPAEECPGFEEFMHELDRARQEMSHRFDRAEGAETGPASKPTTPSAADSPVPAPVPVHTPAPTSIPATKLTPGPASAVSALASAPTPALAPAPAFIPTLTPVAPEPFAESRRTPTMTPHVPAHAHAHAPAQGAAAPSAPAAPRTSTFAAHAPGALPSRLVPFLRGLRPLGIACPVAPEVELAIDEASRMHIVGRADQLARVRTARHWAQVHRELLGLAFAELRGGFEVRERLLLADARDAIALHGTGVLLDLLVTADSPAGPVQVVVALNDANTCG